MLRVAEKLVVARIELPESFHVFCSDAVKRAVVALTVRSILGPAWETNVRVNAEPPEHLFTVVPQRFVVTDEVVRDVAWLAEIVLRSPVHVPTEPQPSVDHEPDA